MPTNLQIEYSKLVAENERLREALRNLYKKSGGEVTLSMPETTEIESLLNIDTDA